MIFERLFSDKTFVYYDQDRGRMVDEAVDQGLVRTFFEKAKGARIKGYRTDKTLVMDVRIATSRLTPLFGGVPPL